MSAVWDLELPPSEKLVLLALADWAHDDGRCWPSIAAVAKKSGVSERTVQRTLRDAEKSGLIKRTETRGKGCEYVINPRHCVTPDNVSPATNATQTPDTVSPNTLGTTISSEAKASSPRAKQSRPDGVSAEQWKAFKAQRKKPLNPHAYTLLTNKLRALAEDGYPPGEMIDLAIERGWETVFKPFKPREKQNGQGQPTGIGRTEAAAIAALASIEGRGTRSRYPD